MTLKSLFNTCAAVCDKHINKNPTACVQTDDGLMLYTDLKAELEKVRDWCYPTTDTKSLQKIVRCQECSYYQACTQVVPQSGNKPQVTMRCSLNNEVVNKDHYCGYAKEKD